MFRRSFAKARMMSASNMRIISGGEIFISAYVRGKLMQFHRVVDNPTRPFLCALVGDVPIRMADQLDALDLVSAAIENTVHLSPEGLLHRLPRVQSATPAVVEYIDARRALKLAFHAF